MSITFYAKVTWNPIELKLSSAVNLTCCSFCFSFCHLLGSSSVCFKEFSLIYKALFYHSSDAFHCTLFLLSGLLIFVNEILL